MMCDEWEAPLTQSRRVVCIQAGVDFPRPGRPDAPPPGTAPGFLLAMAAFRLAIDNTRDSLLEPPLGGPGPSSTLVNFSIYFAVSAFTMPAPGWARGRPSVLSRAGRRSESQYEK
jgi:hypothetical protein